MFTFRYFHQLVFYKVVELGGEGLVSTGLTPSSFPPPNVLQTRERVTKPSTSKACGQCNSIKVAHINVNINVYVFYYPMSPLFQMSNTFFFRYRIVQCQFPNVQSGIPFSNVGFPLSNVSFPLVNFAVPLSNVGFQLPNVSILSANVSLILVFLYPMLVYHCKLLVFHCQRSSEVFTLPNVGFPHLQTLNL